MLTQESHTRSMIPGAVSLRSLPLNLEQSATRRSRKVEGLPVTKLLRDSVYPVTADAVLPVTWESTNP